VFVTPEDAALLLAGGHRVEGLYRDPTKQEQDLNNMASVTPTLTLNSWKVSMFKLHLWLGLLLTGRLDLFAPLLAQAKFETNDFTSYGFNKRNNAFGMRPSQPSATSLNATRMRPKWWNGEDNNFAQYFSTWQSVRDRIDWDTYNDIPTKPPALVATSDAPYMWYMAPVLAAGYVPIQDRPGYAVAWQGKLEKEGSPLLVLLLFAGVTVTLLVLLYRWYRKRKRSK